MALPSEHKSFHTLPVHAVIGGIAGAGLAYILSQLDNAPFANLVRGNEESTLFLMCMIFASYFAVGSAFTAFWFIVTDRGSD